MADIIPKEKVEGFQRWQAGSFDKPKPHAPRQATAEPASKSSSTSSEQPFSLPTAEDIERLYEEARTTGYQAGYDEGRRVAEQAGQEAASVEAQRFLELNTSMQKALDDIDQDVADQLLTLALEVARQVIRSNITVKDDLLLPIIREAVTALPLHHARLTLHLNPQDAAHIRALAGEQFAQQDTQIIENGEIGRGGCLVRTGASEVDATIETRWKRVLEAIGAEPQEWLHT